MTTRDRYSHLHRRLSLESLEARQLLAAGIQNPSNPLDVNDDLRISALDALVIINELGRQRNSQGSGPVSSLYYFDVGGDGATTSGDALRVINAIGRHQADVAFRLSGDTDRDGGTTRDRRTYNLGVVGRVNFFEGIPSLLVTAEPGGQPTWIDISSRVSATGEFSLDDVTIRQILGSQIKRGPEQLRFTTKSPSTLTRHLDIDVLAAPPQPRLVQTEIQEDNEVLLDFIGATYAPDSAASELKLSIKQSPASGTLVPSGNAYVYHPNANYFGTDSLVYEVQDGVDTSGPVTLAITIDSVNDVPTITPIARQEVQVTDGVIRIPVAISDADGTTPDYIAMATIRNPLAEIRDQYKLAYAGDDYFNLTGLNEKWLFSKDGKSYLLMPNGDLVQWQGQYVETADRKSLIASLDVSVYDDLSLLWDAPPQKLVDVAAHIEDGMLTLVPAPGVVGEVTVDVFATDGIADQQQSFVLDISRDYDFNQPELEAVSLLQTDLPTLTQADMPGYVENVFQQVDKFDEQSSQQMIDLVRKLTLIYQSSEQQIASSQQWKAENARVAKLNLQRVDQILADLRILKSEYNAAWKDASDNQSAVDIDLYQDPLKINYDIYTQRNYVRQGEAAELDLRTYSPGLTASFNYFGNGKGEMIDGASIDPTSGLFRWETRDTAPGVYEFGIGISTVYTVGGITQEQYSSSYIEIEVFANRPTIESLTLRPTRISDNATDEITLVAAGVRHPLGPVQAVAFYQDTNNDGFLDTATDRFLGRDELGSDGWSWTGLPREVPDADSVKFMAKAEYDTGSYVLFSDPVSVTAGVRRSAKLDIDVITPIGEPAAIFTAETIPEANHISRYGNGRSVSVGSDDQGNGLYLTRRENLDAIGLGSAVAEPLRLLDDSPLSYSVDTDADGNAVVLYVDNDLEGLHLIRVSAANQITGESTLITDDYFQSLQYTVAMNESGQGVVLWKDDVFGFNQVLVRTLSTTGLPLSDTYTLEYDSLPSPSASWDTAAINESGDYVVSWGNYIATGSAASTKAPGVIYTGFVAERAAMSSSGWTVLATGQEMLAIDPNGQRVSATTLLAEPLAIGNVYDFRSKGDNQFELVTQYYDSLGVDATVLTAQTFSLEQQPDITASGLTITSPGVAQSDQDLSIQFTLNNTSENASDSVPVAIYLSHDEAITRSSRLLDTYQTDLGIASKAATVFETTVTLPGNDDPFWNAGTTSLSLFLSLPTSGKTVRLEIPIVRTSLPASLSVKGDGADNSGDDFPTDPRANQTPRFIRPSVVTEQGFSANVLKTPGIFVVIAGQFVSAANQLARQAPEPLRGQIMEMSRAVQVNVDTFVSESLTLADARKRILDMAASAKNDAVDAAEQEQMRIETEARSIRDKQIAKNNKDILDIQRSRGQLIANETAWLNEQLQIANRQLESLSGSEADIARVSSELAEPSGFALGGVIGFIAEKADNTVSCARDAFTCYNKAVKTLSAQYTKLRDEAFAKLTPAIKYLNDRLPKVPEWVDKRIDDAVTWSKQKSKDAGDVYDATVANGNTVLEEKRQQASNSYNNAKSRLPDLGEGIRVETKSITGVLAKIGDGLDAVIKDPSGLVEQARKQLDELDQNNPFGSVQKIIGQIQVPTDIAETVLSDLSKDLAPVFDTLTDGAGKFADWAKTTGGSFSDWVKDAGDKAADWVNKNLGDLLHQEIVAYQLDTDFALSLNLANGAVYADAKIGPGWKYDSHKLQGLLQGNFAFPDIDPVEAISRMYGFELIVNSDYDAVHAAQNAMFGPQNVYFGSDRFVSYFGLETVAAVAAESIVTGGQASKDALESLGEHLRLEINDILSWLQFKGEQQLSSIVPDVIKALITQTDIVLPQLEVHWTPVTYHYELKENPMIGKAIKAVTAKEVSVSELVGGKKLDADLQHLCFSIVWQGSQPAGSLDPSVIDAAITDYANKFDLTKFGGASLDTSLVDTALTELQSEGVPKIVIDVLNLLRNQTVDVSQFTTQLSRKLADTMGINLSLIKEQLGHRTAGNVVIDLAATPAGTELKKLLGKMTFGNAGEAKLDKFTLDLTNYRLEINGTLRHKQSWGSIGDIVSGLGKAIGGG